MTTKHTCGGPVFGRKTAGCPRCDELLAGAMPVQWAIQRRREQERRDVDAIRAHFSSHKHVSGGCGVVFTVRRMVGRSAQGSPP